MTNATYRAGIIGLGFIGGADQVSGDALGQQVSGLDGTHFDALSNHPPRQPDCRQQPRSRTARTLCTTRKHNDLR